MIQLFPSIKNRMTVWLLAYMALIFLLGLLGLVNIPVLLLISLAGFTAIIAVHYAHASRAHEALLGKLYNSMDAEGFIRDYEPLLSIDVKHPALSMAIRLHLSDAYCALGRFDDAAALLSSISFPSEKQEEADLIARCTVLSSLCACALLKGDVPAAQRSMDDMLSCKQRLDAAGATAPQMQRLSLSILLNQQCLALLTTGRCDASVLRGKVHAKNTQMLHRVTTGLWIARALLADNNPREAKELLEKIAKVAGHLFAGREAKALLLSLACSGKTSAAE